MRNGSTVIYRRKSENCFEAAAEVIIIPVTEARGGYNVNVFPGVILNELIPSAVQPEMNSAGSAVFSANNPMCIGTAAA